MFRQLLLAALAGLVLSSSSSPSDKICHKLTATLATQSKVNIAVSFVQDTFPVLQQATNLKFATRGEKITFLRAQLVDLQESSQKNLLNLLSTLSGIRVQSNWINNRLYIQDATAELISTISSFPEVQHIREQIVASIGPPLEAHSIQNITANEWNIEKIEADGAWSLPGGNNGQGVVVCVIDDGVRQSHEALRNNWRQDYGWWDPMRITFPPPHDMDSSGHGTHVTGTIAGAGGIGVAPGAQWIACKACSNNEGCPEYALISCGEFAACPVAYDGQNPDCSKAPHIASNSWGGGQDDPWYDEVIQFWRAADVIPVFALGNDGPSCSTTLSPGDRPNVISAGATTSEDAIATFSSRGSTSDGRIKPEVSAPGEDVRSAMAGADNAYASGSGTSMACPHVSGAVALLLSQNPNLTFGQVRSLLQANADRGNLGRVQECGGIPNDQFPNNVYGHGRINARKSLEAAINNRV